MKPMFRHRICARPLAICWLLGALLLWVFPTATFWDEGVFPAALSNVSMAISLLIGYACVAGVGFFVGGMAFFWPVTRFCRWINGGPYIVGDRVTILTGRHAGTTTAVYELARGQGGNLLPRVELGAEARSKYSDIFDDFVLLRALPSNTASPDAPDASTLA